MNNYLKHITTVEIPALKGKRVIADQSKIFAGWIADFKSYGADKSGVATKKMKIDVFELVEDGRFSDFLLPDNLLTQDQIIYFVEKHKDLLKKDWYTFLPFKSGDEIFVADVRFDDYGRLGVDVRRFSRDDVWYAEYRHRVVVPQLTPRHLESSPSDSLTLISRIKSLESWKAKVEKVLKVE